MSKPFIFGTTVIRPEMEFLAKEYHRHHGDSHVQVVTLYRVSHEPDGTGGIEWLLTRFHDKAGKAYSAILCVKHDGREEYLHEFFANGRKSEKAMIEEWKTFVEEEDDEAFDADALIKGFEDAGLGDHSLIESVFAAGVYAGIENAPTIDAVPVVHGQWDTHTFSNRVDTYGNPDTCAKCSECGFLWNYERDVRRYFCFCPNCGAKMDGGASDGSDA